MVLEKFKSRLRLTSDQAKQVQVILEQTHQRFKDLNQSIKPQSDEIRHGMRGRIRELLSEEQKKEFEVMTREYDQRRTREESS